MYHWFWANQLYLALVQFNQVSWHGGSLIWHPWIFKIFRFGTFLPLSLLCRPGGWNLGPCTCWASPPPLSCISSSSFLSFIQIFLLPFSHKTAITFIWDHLKLSQLNGLFFLLTSYIQFILLCVKSELILSSAMTYLLLISFSILSRLYIVVFLCKRLIQAFKNASPNSPQFLGNMEYHSNFLEFSS